MQKEASSESLGVAAALLEVPVSGWICNMILDASVAMCSRMAVLIACCQLLEIPVSGWLLIRNFLFVLTDLDALINCIRLGHVGIYADRMRTGSDKIDRYNDPDLTLVPLSLNLGNNVAVRRAPSPLNSVKFC